MNILITSIGRRSYMIDYFKSAIGETGKVFAANNELTYALKKAGGYILTPKIYDENYIDFILQYCLDNKINAVISLFDIDLPILSKNKRLFAENDISLLISDYEFTVLCNDKWASYHFLKENNFKTALSYISLDNCKKAISDKNIEYPIFVKPRWGMGSIGVFEAENEKELDVFYAKTKKAILKTYLKHESSFDIDNSIILQEKIKGLEHGLDIFNDLKGNYLGCVPKIKNAMRAGETDIATTLHNENLVSIAKRLSLQTKHKLNLDVDCFIDGEEIFILEMNPRFGGQYPFSHAAGVNFPKAIIDLLEGNELDQEDFQFDEIKIFKDFEIRKYE